MDSSHADKVQDDNLVIIDYKDLLPGAANAETSESGEGSTAPNHHSLHVLLSKAFGTSPASSASSASTSQSLGLIAIRNIPEFIETKEAFLPLAHKLISLPKSYLDEHLTDETSMYNAGWSYGKEKLKMDVPDLSKGSFYFNPITDMPGTEEERRLYPASYPVNKWPNGSGSCDSVVPMIMMRIVIIIKMAFHSLKNWERN
jgi:hypothetical protein